MLNKIQVDIANSERELVQIELKHIEQLKKIEDDLRQEKEQSLTMVDSIIQTLEHVML